MESRISGHTKLYCLIGSPVGHSGSPAMYNYSFERTGIDAAYLAFNIPLEETEKAVQALKTLGVGGFNVTMPDKTAVASYLDALSPAAKLIGACNTVTVGEDGATHQFCEDMALMRSLPNMTVVNPADATEAFAAVEAILNYNCPVYFRLGRYAVPVVFDPAGYRFELGKGRVLRDGKDAVIFATGIMVAAALEAGELLAAEGIDAAVVNIHTLKPLDEPLVLEYAAKTGRVVTAEEHTVIGGLGGAVAELLSEKLPTRMKRVGVNDCFGKSAPAKDALNLHGLNAASVAQAVRTLVRG